MSSYQSQYVAKKAFFSFLGNSFRLLDAAGNLQFFVKQKAFKLKEEITVFKDEAQTQKRLTIKARGIGDFSGVYDITDAESGQAVGGAKRQGLKSLFKDEWDLLDPEGGVVGKVQEVGGILILLRRFLPIIPQTYEVTLGQKLVGIIKQQFNPFQLAYDVDFSKGEGSFDPRLGVGMTVLLLAIEGGKQN